MGHTALPPLSDLRREARGAWPERRLRRFRVHQEGWGNLVLEADGRLIFRFPRTREAGESLRFEIRVLELLSTRLSSPIPVPIRLSTLSSPRGWPFIVYAKVPGVPLSQVGSLDSAGKRSLGTFVGTLLRELAALPSRPFRRIGTRPGNPRALAQEYRGLQDRVHRVVEPRLSPALQSNLIDAFDRFYSDLRGTRYREVVTHRDLGSDHILWDSKLNRPSGVIDWGDTCLCDPAFDLIALGGMGLANLDEWARVRGADIDSTFDSRLSFYRRVWPVHGALYAAATRNAQLFRDSVARLAANFDR